MKDNFGVVSLSGAFCAVTLWSDGHVIRRSLLMSAHHR